MTEYSKDILCNFIDEDDDEEDNFISIKSDTWPYNITYYCTFSNIDLDLYSNMCVQIHYHYKHEPHKTYKSKCSYLRVATI